ncbi:MAG TPA: phospholipase D-like domain-containing protein [Gemmatimonadaceae bacterium]|nr:phospholipase D-like domain-containing protein [Gemmatimonadaceae bacterium]
MNRALMIVGVAITAVIILGLALVGVLYLTRGTPVSHIRSPDGDFPAVEDSMFPAVAELLGRLTLVEGNHLELMTNGDETYPRLWEDLRSARRSITLQMYYCRPGQVADTLRTILIERAAAGVRVLFLFDAFGSQDLPEEYFDALRAGGVEVVAFRPVHWYKVDKVSHRSHIRVVVVDGAIGYTGGFGIDDKWLGDGRTEGQWRDTNARFRGPVVHQLQATFVAGWAEATGDLLVGSVFFPEEESESRDGRHRASLMHAAPTIGSTAAERFLALSIASARRTLYISNSYFVPDDDFREMLEGAARRGVDVRLLTASEKTDVKTAWYAGRSRYERLLEAGVRIYEYQPTMMHAKTFVVDGLWSCVGTMNFDTRSLAFNDETNLVALDGEFGARMDSVFLADLELSREITLEEFRRRSWTMKVRERAAASVARFL